MLDVETSSRPGKKTSWLSVSSPNALDEVYKLYFNKEVDKSLKKIFIKGSMDDVRQNFQVDSNSFNQL